MFSRRNDIPSVLLVQTSSSPYSKTRVLIDECVIKLQERPVAYSVLDLCGLTIDLCDGRPLESYGEQTRSVCSRIAQASRYLLTVPVYGDQPGGHARNIAALCSASLKNKPIGLLCSAPSKNKSYAASVTYRSELMQLGITHVVQPIVLASDQDFRGSHLFDDAISHVIEEAIDSLFQRWV